MKKISIFTNHFYPEVFGINDIATILSKTNKVEVVTQIPNYPKGDYFPGFGILKKRRAQINDNLIVKRLFVIPRKKSKCMLVLNYISYIFSSMFYSIFNFKRDSDLVLVYVTSPIFISWAAIWHAKRSKSKIVMYLLDLWPHNFIKMLGIKNKRIIQSLNKLCLRIYSQMDVIYVSSNAFFDILIELGVSESKLRYMPQHETQISAERSVKKDKTLNILFAGNIGYAQGLDMLIEVASKLNQNQIKNVHFNIVGDGRYLEEFKDCVNSKGLKDYFTFFGRIDKKDLKQHYLANDFGLVILKDDPILNLHLPAKVQSYMANSVPILCMANGESSRIVRDSNAGVVIENNNPESVFEEIIKLRDIPYDEIQTFGENGYKYSTKHFSLEKINKELEDNLR